MCNTTKNMSNECLQGIINIVKISIDIMSPFDENGKYVRIPSPLKNNKRDIIIDLPVRLNRNHYLLIGIVVVISIYIISN